MCEPLQVGDYGSRPSAGQVAHNGSKFGVEQPVRLQTGGVGPAPVCFIVQALSILTRTLLDFAAWLAFQHKGY